MKNDFCFLQNFLMASGDEIFVCDMQGNIILRNEFAQKSYPKIPNIRKISHLFNFEICILNSEDITTYNPVSAALNSGENFSAEAVKQISENLFAQYTITSFSYSDNTKVIILRNDTNYNMSENYADLENRTAKLEKEIASSQGLKLSLENQLLKTKLINLVSEKVQKYISTEKILKITLEQLRKTLDIEKAEFISDFSSKSFEIKFFSNNAEKKVMQVPIYLDKKAYGAIVLTKKISGQNWQKDETELVKSVCAILSTAFAKEELYREIENQKKNWKKHLLS